MSLGILFITPPIVFWQFYQEWRSCSVNRMNNMLCLAVVLKCPPISWTESTLLNNSNSYCVIIFFFRKLTEHKSLHIIIEGDNICMNPLGSTGSQSCSAATPKECLLLFRWPGSHGPVKTAGYVPICLINAASYQVVQKGWWKQVETAIDHSDLGEGDTAECKQCLFFRCQFLYWGKKKWLSWTQVNMYAVDTLVARSVL